MPRSLETKAALKSMQLALLGWRIGVSAPVRRRPTLNFCIFYSSFLSSLGRLNFRRPNLLLYLFFKSAQSFPCRCIVFAAGIFKE